MNNIIVDRNDDGVFDLATIDLFVKMMVGDIDRKIVIQARRNDGVCREGLLRGSCTNMRPLTNIQIYNSAIELSVQKIYPLGGNVTPALSLREGAYLVLAHELRHAQKYKEDGHPTMDDSLPMRDQYFEIDARDFVDMRYFQIVSFARRFDV